MVRNPAEIYRTFYCLEGLGLVEFKLDRAQLFICLLLCHLELHTEVITEMSSTVSIEWLFLDV